MSYVVNVDIGTGSGRAIAFDEAGRAAASSQCEWLPRAIPEYPGAQDFDTAGAWKLLSGCLRDLLAKMGKERSQIVAVTSTAMREGMVLYDKDGAELWACPNVDARAVEEAAEMIGRGLADRLYGPEATGPASSVRPDSGGFDDTCPISTDGSPT